MNLVQNIHPCGVEILDLCPESYSWPIHAIYLLVQWCILARKIAYNQCSGVHRVFLKGVVLLEGIKKGKVCLPISKRGLLTFPFLHAQVALQFNIIIFTFIIAIYNCYLNLFFFSRWGGVVDFLKELISLWRVVEATS